MIYLARDYHNGTTWFYPGRPTMGPEGTWVSDNNQAYEWSGDCHLAKGELISIDLAGDTPAINRLGVFEPNPQELKGYK